VSYCCLTPIQQFFSAISWREQVNFQWSNGDDDDVDDDDDDDDDDKVQHAELDKFYYSASSLKQQSAGRHVTPPWHIILIPNQPVCSFSLMLRA
jgi:hypothetical protein